ncbi:MAG TPA: hypothetical protein VK096_05950, partial [Actinomycetales bacterium]|nr:hypothetical protein [Actinomycetales bacterium]
AGTLDVPLCEPRAEVTGPRPVDRGFFTVDARGAGCPIRGLPATGGAGVEALVAARALAWSLPIPTPNLAATPTSTATPCLQPTATTSPQTSALDLAA